jgi:hypothetical protein
VRAGAARARLLVAPEGAPGFRAFLLVCLAVVAAGWGLRGERYLSPEQGVGYALGLVGLALLLCQLLYSVRKRARSAGSAGRLHTWLGAHMWLGILGPTAILFHSNFRVGAFNSVVALACMGLVVASGLVGRFLYRKVHARLFDRRLELRWLEQDLRLERGALAGLLQHAPEVAERLRSFETGLLARPPGPARSAWRFVSAGFRSARARSACRALLRRPARAVELDREEALEALDHYLAAVVRVTRFTSFERLFALWHPLHVPLCALLFGAATLHVIAVHWY